MTINVDLRPVRTARELAQFIDIPWRIDRALGGDPCWVPPLRLGVKAALDPRHPFWQRNERQLWIAFQEGAPVGRIAAILNREHQEHWRDATGFWGFFETIDQPQVAGALLSAAEAWLLERGCDTAVGPVSPSPHYEMGILTSGFDAPPYLMLTHNPPYYPGLLAGAGYEKAVDLYAYLIPSDGVELAGKVERVGEVLERRWGVTVRTGEMRHFAREAAIIHRLYNASMLGQWGFTPIGESEFAAFAADLKRILDPDLVLFAERRGEPIGFLLALPNLNEIFLRIRDGRLLPFGLLKLLWLRRSVRSARVILIGMLPEWQRRGVGSLLYREIARRLVEKGYADAEMSWVLEDNVLMNRAARLLGGFVHKTYRVYRKGLRTSLPC
ncbi:MAG: GNAT family N-acetyltransferase [Thermoanaerobaculia bacterium]